MLVKIDPHCDEQHSDVVRKILSSEQQSVELLFNKYRNALERYLVKLLRNEEDAEELLQEIFLRLLERTGLNHLEKSNVRAYLFRVAGNLVIDKARREKVRARDQHVPADGMEFPSDQPCPSKLAEWDQDLSNIKQAVLGLRPQCRQIFIICRFKGLSYPEIAEIFGITTRTVERNMSIAIAHIKANLDQN